MKNWCLFTTWLELFFRKMLPVRVRWRGIEQVRCPVRMRGLEPCLLFLEATEVEPFQGIPTPFPAAGRGAHARTLRIYRALPAIRSCMSIPDNIPS